MPLGQGRHSAWEGRFWYVPEAQSEQADAPSVLETEPAAQGGQALRPVTGAWAPAGQAMQLGSTPGE